MMWVLLNKVMWPCSSASVLWCYGDTGLEVHNSYLVITCFKVKFYKIVLVDFSMKSDCSIFS